MSRLKTNFISFYFSKINFPWKICTGISLPKKRLQIPPLPVIPSFLVHFPMWLGTLDERKSLSSIIKSQFRSNQTWISNSNLLPSNIFPQRIHLLPTPNFLKPLTLNNVGWESGLFSSLNCNICSFALSLR